LQFDGTEVPIESVDGLVVTIVGADVEPAGSVDQFPTWSNYNELACGAET
jgi:hypothetical protein